MRPSRTPLVFILPMIVFSVIVFPGQATTQEIDAPYYAELVVGELEGQIHEVFGRIRDVAALPDGRFVVLDDRLQQIRLYAASGKLQQIAGRAGRGPGELFVPESLDLSNIGVLTVLDRGNAQLARWIMEDDTLVFRETTRVPFQAYDHCTIDGRDFLVGTRQALMAHSSGVTMIHELSASGEILRSFGEATSPGKLPEPFYSIAQRILNKGPIECSDERDEIYWLPGSIGDIHGFSDQGKQLWQLELPGFIPLDAVMTERGTMRYEPLRTGRLLKEDEWEGASWTVGTSITELPSGSLLVQMDSLWYPTPLENRKVIGYVIDGGNGVVESDKLALPKVGSALGDRLFAWRELPFPAVMVLLPTDRR